MTDTATGTQEGVDFTDAERSFLAEARLARIATVSEDGEVDVAPVVFRLDEQGRLVVGGRDQPHTFKYKNVRAGSRAALVVDDLESVDPWRPRGVKVHGDAQIVTRPDGREVIVITPRRKWSWGLG
jgi:pyridoxamine 5'-phosphate oxidase family protein